MNSIPFPIHSIDVNKPMAVIHFSNSFSLYLDKYYSNQFEELVIMCIGTDRSTGDSLGPLIGYKLEKLIRRHENIFVEGTLEKPVHAKNLKETIDSVYKCRLNPFIIAIDACLGKIDRIGFVTIGHGPLRPGAGVNKDLPSVGDIHITGIVNLGGFMEYIILQNTRLGLVMKMADTIAEGIQFGLWKHIKTIKEQSGYN
ncbi:MAG: spore protease YyaC [Alkaliphilus sp.]|nr:spore protease YyaC [Alkaliphilus sp.]